MLIIFLFFVAVLTLSLFSSPGGLLCCLTVLIAHLKVLSIIILWFYWLTQLSINMVLKPLWLWALINRNRRLYFSSISLHFKWNMYEKDKWYTFYYQILVHILLTLSFLISSSKVMHFNSFRHTLMILQYAVYGKIKWHFFMSAALSAISPLKSNI